jgi:glucose-1-phosphate adenylyltransferase
VSDGFEAWRVPGEFLRPSGFILDLLGRGIVMQDVLGLILGGGRGAALYPLTMRRSEPAVPLAGKYRLIDIPLSNCINSGIRRVYVLTQFLSTSLHRHIAHTYHFDPFGRGFIEILAAQQTNEAAQWYLGTADAVRQNISFIHDEDVREVLLLCGDQLYRMDFQRMVENHRASEADVTLAAVATSRTQASRLGILRCDDSERIIRIMEKPQTGVELDSLRTPPEWFRSRGVVSPEREYLANMGIYLFTRPVLDRLLEEHPKALDLVREVFPQSLAHFRFRAHLFQGYWDDLGSIKSYFEAHLAMAGPHPPFDFASVEGLVFTRMRNLPPSRIHQAHLENCLISDGCIVGAGARLERSIIGIRSRIGRNVTLRETVFNGADSIETEEQRADNRWRGIPHLGIGESSIIERAILDRDCRIGRNVRILNKDDRPNLETPFYVIRDGIVVIPDGTVVPDETVI